MKNKYKTLKELKNYIAKTPLNKLPKIGKWVEIIEDNTKVIFNPENINFCETCKKVISITNMVTGETVYEKRN